MIIDHNMINLFIMIVRTSNLINNWLEKRINCSYPVHVCIGSFIQNKFLIYKIKKRSIINQRHDGTHMEKIVTYGLKKSRKKGVVFIRSSKTAALRKN